MSSNVTIFSLYQLNGKGFFVRFREHLRIVNVLGLVGGGIGEINRTAVNHSSKERSSCKYQTSVKCYDVPSKNYD